MHPASLPGFLKQHWGIFFFLVMVLFIVPLAEIPAFADAQVPARLVLFAAAIAGFFLFHKRGTFFEVSNDLPSGIQLALFFFVVIHWVSLLWSPSFSEGVQECIRISLGVCWFYAVATLIRKFEFDLSAFYLVFAFAALAFLIIEIAQWPATVFITYGQVSYPPGPFGNSNLFGEVALLLFPFMVLFFILSRGLYRWISLVSGFCLLVILAFCHSAGVFFGLAVFIIVFWFLFARIKRGVGATSVFFRPVFICGFLFLCTLLFALNFSFNGKGLGNYFNRNLETLFSKDLPKLESGNSSAQERIVLWKNTWRLIQDHPVRGHGAGSWKHEIGKYGFRGIKSGYGDRFFPAPHNDFLWLWSETGIAGVVSWLFALALAGWYCLSALSQKLDFARKITAAAIFSILGAWTVLSFFAYPLGPVFHTILIFLLLALAASLSGRKPNIDISVSVFLSDLGKRLGFLAGPSMAFAYSGFAIYVFVASAPGQIKAKKAMTEFEARNWPGFIAATESLKENNWVSAEPESGISWEWYRGIAFDSLKKNQGAGQAYLIAAKESPYQPQVLFSLAKWYAGNGENHDARKEFDALLQRFPDFCEAGIFFADYLLQNGDSLAAETVAKNFDGDCVSSWLKSHR